MGRGGKRAGAGRKRVLDDETMLCIGLHCEKFYDAKRYRRETELWDGYTDVVTRIPLADCAGMFGPHQTPLTDRAWQFQADADEELATIVGAKRLADAEAELAESIGGVTRHVPPRLIMLLALHALLIERWDETPAPYGVRETIIEDVWGEWRERVPHLTPRRVIAAWKKARALRLAPACNVLATYADLIGPAGTGERAGPDRCRF